MCYVAGKPVTVFTRIRVLLNNPDYAPLVSQVHFLALDDPAILKEYVASNISTRDYAWLDGNVNTAAVKAVLVSVDFSSKQNAYYQQRCEALENLGKAIREQFTHLKDMGHPKWKEVDLEQQIGIWQRDTCSSPSTATEQLPVEATKPDTTHDPNMLLNTIEKILTTDSK